MTRVFVAGRGYVVPDGWDRWIFDGRRFRRTGEAIEGLSVGQWWEATVETVVAPPLKYVGESLVFWK